MKQIFIFEHGLQAHLMQLRIYFYHDILGKLSLTFPCDNYVKRWPSLFPAAMIQTINDPAITLKSQYHQIQTQTLLNY